ncbi:hypothetical protein RSOLAG1IB_07574 [Rhizoctonia solani AG-1 IB]|uniref:Uncharacterized protein n=1 Tax=Thanatephorus cucumeris (strain AG1-IB / isolate 7/3/14) TaxID=1108050 RepID=A0A0B7FDM7_THACB|nr:hypothetical protein RSOLAG1IB_07574 [Rhizoctonia solani AG-1 IB]
MDLEESTRPTKRLRVDDSADNDSMEGSGYSAAPGPISPNYPSHQHRSLRSRPHTRSQARLLCLGLCVQNDVLPEAPRPIEDLPESPNIQPTIIYKATALSTTVPPPALRPVARKTYQTGTDTFGRYYIYRTKPVTIPDIDAPMSVILPQRPSEHRILVRSVKEIVYPCPNISTFYIQAHHWLQGNTKSLNDRERLCNNVLARPDFNPRDVVGFNFKRLDDQLCESAKTRNALCPPSEGWHSVSLALEIPPVRQTAAMLKQQTHPLLKRYINIPGLRSRKLTDIIYRAFSTNNPKTFHYEPRSEYYEPPGQQGARFQIFGEIYSSPSMLKAHQEVQHLKIADAACKLPRCVAYMMCSSDGLQFGSFCHASGHPIYVFFGNESKYERCKPTSKTCFHVAHMPTLPDSVQEEICEAHGGRPPNGALITHLRRELVHAVWGHILDDDFVDAWKNGMVVECADGIERRVFPRIKVNSVDYPEKTALSTIRNMGTCHCPRCLSKKSAASKIGTASDTRARTQRRTEGKQRMTKILEARRLIYELGHSVQSQSVEKLLSGESYVPTMNAFSHRLGELKFNIFETFVVDLLHEVELGVWKSVLKHHIRVLHLNGSASVTEFNKRFRSVPTFGAAIRLFSEDVASMSRLAARDFEDILQCCTPVFEGLIPEQCAESSRTLLFVFAQWHGIAKLRLHTSETLKILKKLTVRLGFELRQFAELTQDMDVRETPKEYLQRRKRAEARTSSTQKAQVRTKGKSQTSAATSNGRRRCELNLNTHKVHALGDYVEHIQEFGTTDSYSTQIPELAHQKVKLQYNRTNKQDDSVNQMTHVNDICEVLRDMQDELAQRQQKLLGKSPPDSVAIQALLDGSRYTIGQTDRSEDRIPSVSQWVHEQRNDDATKFFIPQLKRHLLARLLGGFDHANFNEEETSQVRLLRNTMYQHKTLRLNYTSYDVQRQQDLVNPTTPSRFIFLPSERTTNDNFDGTTNHPFLYAKVLGIYHADVLYRQYAPRRMDFVHVRWLYYDYEQPGGWDTFRLDRVGYEPCGSDEDNLDSFDFVDPSDIIRAAHLIPDFQSGASTALLDTPHSLSHDDPNRGTDWCYYYVNRFVDRDILMRYLGGGVGHYHHSVMTNEEIATTSIEDPGDTAEDQLLEVQEQQEYDDTEESDKELERENQSSNEAGGNGIEDNDIIVLTEGEDEDEEDEEDESDLDENESLTSDLNDDMYEY